MMQPSFSDLISTSELQQLLDDFHSSCGISVCVFDLNTRQIAASAGQHLLEKAQPDASQFFHWLFQSEESPSQAEPYVLIHRELPGGLHQFARLIRVESREIAALILGPLSHAAPDPDQLRSLAEAAGFEPATYLQAVKDTPVVDPGQARCLFELLAQLVQRLAEKGLGDLRIAETLRADQERRDQQQQAFRTLEARLRERTAELERVNTALQESERRFQVALVDTPVVVFNQDLDLRYTWIYNPQNYADQPVIGKTDADLFPPEDAARLAALKRRVIAAGLLTREEVSMRVGGRTVHYDMTLDPLYDANGAVIGLTCAATDITERKQIEEELRRRLAEIEGIQRIARGLLQKVGMKEVLEIVCAEAMQLTGAQGSAVMLLEEDGWLELTHQAGSPVSLPERLPLQGSFPGRAVLSGSHVWITRQDGDPAGDASQGQGVPWTPGLFSILSVPLTLEQQPVGVLNILNKPGEVSVEDLRILNLFADQAAIIIEHVRLQQRAEQFAVLEERQRLARELHDSVTQALYSLTLYIDAARLAFSRKQWEALERNLEEARNMAREVMFDMRLLVFELRPFMLEKEGLVSALRARLAAVEDRAGLKTELLVEGERRLPVGIETELYRIAQEALNNVVKHARAGELQIDLRFEEQAVRLEIIDNGLGFDPQSAVRSGGVGLRGMQERVQQLGGTLEINSALGRGTRLKVSIPVNPGDYT